jgi:hypothetical protein
MFHGPSFQPLQLPILQQLHITNDLIVKRLKIKLTPFHTLDKLIKHFSDLTPIVEESVRYEEDVIRREAKAISEYFATDPISLPSRRATLMGHARPPLERFGTREIKSNQDIFRTLLDQFTALHRYRTSQGAKTYKSLFNELSTDNGPWQTDTALDVTHRKLSGCVLGRSCRFRMRRNWAYTDHAEASRARDSGVVEDTPDVTQRKLAALKMTAFKGDFALVAAMQSPRDQVGFVAGSVLLKCDARLVTMGTVDSGTLSLTADSLFFDSARKYHNLPLTTFKKVLFRRYLLVDSALEIFTTLRTVYFIDFSGDDRSLFIGQESPIYQEYRTHQID